jgi:hypothetical protein
MIVFTANTVGVFIIILSVSLFLAKYNNMWSLIALFTTKRPLYIHIPIMLIIPAIVFLIQAFLEVVTAIILRTNLSLMQIITTICYSKIFAVILSVIFFVAAPILGHFLAVLGYIIVVLRLLFEYWCYVSLGNEKWKALVIAAVGVLAINFMPVGDFLVKKIGPIINMWLK